MKSAELGLCLDKLCWILGKVGLKVRSKDNETRGLTVAKPSTAPAKAPATSEAALDVSYKTKHAVRVPPFLIYGLKSDSLRHDKWREIRKRRPQLGKC